MNKCNKGTLWKMHKAKGITLLNNCLQKGLTNKKEYTIVKMLDEVLNEHLITTRKEKNMRVQAINIKPITFTEGNLNKNTPKAAILSLQKPNAKINFENDVNHLSRNAEHSSDKQSSVRAKLRKTYNILFAPDYSQAPEEIVRYLTTI